MAKYVAEFAGTFVFVLIILLSVRALTNSRLTAIIPFAVAIGLIAGIFVCLGAGGDAHLNPAVSTMFAVKGDLNANTLVTYVIAQVAGAVLAYFVYRLLLANESMAGKPTTS